MTESNLGFSEEPKNGCGITRAMTRMQIRSWDMPRTQEALEKFNTEIGKSDFPGLYILFSKQKLYVGEAKSLYNRVKTHVLTPEDKIKDWNRVLIINDGRPAAQSIFNDSVVRRALEYFLIKLFKANKFSIVCQGEPQTPNSSQAYTIDSLKQELNFFLNRKGIISKPLDERGQELVFGDELKKLLEKSGRKITKWGANEVELEGIKTFVRPGSKKSRGWQITIRGRKPGSFIDSLSKGNGSLLIPRDGIVLIPLSEIQKVIKDKSAYDQDTIDIWVTFGDQIILRFKSEELDVTEFRLFGETRV